MSEEMAPAAGSKEARKRVMVLGATGTIGQATVRALIANGHEVVCFLRRGSRAVIPGAALRHGDVTDPLSLARDGFRANVLTPSSPAWHRAQVRRRMPGLSTIRRK